MTPLRGRIAVFTEPSVPYATRCGADGFALFSGWSRCPGAAEPILSSQILMTGPSSEQDDLGFQCSCTEARASLRPDEPVQHPKTTHLPPVLHG